MTSVVGNRCQQEHRGHDLSNVQYESTKTSYFRGLRSELHITRHSTFCEGSGSVNDPSYSAPKSGPCNSAPHTKSSPACRAAAPSLPVTLPRRSAVVPLPHCRRSSPSGPRPGSNHYQVLRPPALPPQARQRANSNAFFYYLDHVATLDQLAHLLQPSTALSRTFPTLLFLLHFAVQWASQWNRRELSSRSSTSLAIHNDSLCSRNPIDIDLNID